MSKGPMVGLADLARILAESENDEELEARASALGYEKRKEPSKDCDDTPTESEE